MDKDELILALQQISGNPVVILKEKEGEWREIRSVLATGEHRNAITVSLLPLPPGERVGVRGDLPQFNTFSRLSAETT